MKETTNNSTQLFTPPFGGRGAKKYIAPEIELIQLDNEISLALESAPPAGPSETLNSIQSPFNQESGLV
jgi:hypothetical protein